MKAVLVIVCFALIFCSSVGALDNIQQVLNGTKDFEFFATHLRLQNPTLWNLLAEDTPGKTYTVFATLNNGANVNVTNSDTLNYQVVYGTYDGKFVPLDTIATLYNDSSLGANVPQVIALSNLGNATTWVINGQSIITGPSIAASNGYVHGVSETILIPVISLTQIPESNSTLAAIFKKLNITTPPGIPASTFLIPTENNFASLFEQFPLYKTYLLDTYTTAANTNLQTIINAHLLPDIVYPNQLPPYNVTAPYPSRDSKASIRFFRTQNLSTEVIEIIDDENNRYPITQPNVLAPNGVGHYFDGLIIPENFQLTLQEVLVAGQATKLIDALTKLNLLSTFLNITGSTLFIPVGANVNFTGVTADNLLLHVVTVQNASFSNGYVPTALRLPTLANNPQQVLLETMNVTTNNVTIPNVKLVDRIPVINQIPYVTSEGNYVYFIEVILTLPGAPLPTLNTQGYSEFLSLIGFAGDNVAFNRNQTTIFAPTNDAINNLQPGVVGYLTLNGTFYTELVEAVIGNHVVPDNVLYRFPVANNTQYQTLNKGNPILVDNNGLGRIVINGYATVESNSYPTENGIIRPIDSVIIPLGVSFNLSQILQGLGNEKFTKDNYGSYNRFLSYLQVSGVLEQLEGESFTLFAPTDEAFENAVDNFVEVFNNNTSPSLKNETLENLITALNYHVIYDKDLSTLVAGVNSTATYPVGNDKNTNVEVAVVGNKDMNDLKNYQITLLVKNENNTIDNKGSGNLVVNTTTSTTQRIYGINRVLGLPVKPSASPSASSDHHKGLTTAEWVLIGVGGAALGLILLLIVAGVVYYLLIRPKSGYRKIN